MKITVTPGFKEAHRDDVAYLFWEAFQGKLAPSLGTSEKALRFIAQGLRQDFAFSAQDDHGTLLGAAGIKTQKGGFLTGSYSDIAAIYGPISAVWRSAVLEMFERKLTPTVLQMDGIFVAEGARGLGVGTKLLDAVVWTARMNRCTQVTLDVVEENTRARALYERYGFRETGRVKAGLMAPLMGFKEATTMALDVS
ncbi:MAG: GNAT family N-acetyltransferase [Rhodobacteraceae bacterium]|nr:GNAT family N-acetyltransferase [Paracoccaceae bacterium]